MKCIKIFAICGLLFSSFASQAALHLELTQGVDSAIPLAIVPFTSQGGQASNAEKFTQVITNDLQNSGEFRVKTPEALVDQPESLSDINLEFWKKQAVNDLLMGQVNEVSPGKFKVSFSLVDLYEKHSKKQNSLSPNAVILNQSFSVEKNGLRHLAHHVSDLIYQKLTGVRGIFSTKIAYVLAQRPPGKKAQYLLEVADADGFNPETLLRSTQPIMSPAWLPNGRAIAYVSFEGHQASIYLQELSSGKRELISRFPGINGAPAFSPDGKRIALVLTKTGNPKIYALNLATHKLKQITAGYSIDTEPAWSPDGNIIYFTSNRSGGPQIYQYDFVSNQVSRVTFDGNYNARAQLTPQGISMVMMHRDSGIFGLAKQNLSSGRVTVLTASGSDESPSLAPNGKMVLYGTKFAGRNVLGVVSMDGRVKLRLPAQEGNVQDPAWSPYLS